MQCCEIKINVCAAQVDKKDLHVDTAKLLTKHNDPRSHGGASIAGDAEQLPEHGEEVLALVHFPLKLHTDISIEEVATSLQFRVPDPTERAVGLVDFVVLEQPSRRLWAEVDLEHDEDGGYEAGCEHVAPGDIFWE